MRCQCPGAVLLIASSFDSETKRLEKRRRLKLKKFMETERDLTVELIEHAVETLAEPTH